MRVKRKKKKFIEKYEKESYNRCRDYGREVKRVNLREQEYIYTIAKYRSITKAAKELNITQSALSLFVQNVEKKLGAPLFERYKKEVLPTYVGELYLESAKKILAEGEKFDLQLQAYFTKGKGRVRFGINSRRSPLIVPKLLIEMRKLYPNVEIIVKESDTLSLVSMLLSNELDCVYTYEKVQDKAIHSSLLLNDRVGLAINSKSPLLKYAVYDKERGGYCMDLKYLKDETFLLYENDETRVEFDRLTAEAGFNPRIQEYYNVETMLELVDKGYGVSYMNEAYIPDFLNKRRRESVKFILTGRKSDKVEVYLSYHERMKSQSYGRKFIEILTNSQG